MFDMYLGVRLPVKLRVISELSAALAFTLGLAACDRPGPTTDIDQVPPQALQQSTSALVEPHRYSSLSNLAGAIRKAGYPCEVVKSYKQVEQNDKGSAVYRIDCLEYSFLLTIINGQSRLKRLPANAIRE